MPYTPPAHSPGASRLDILPLTTSKPKPAQPHRSRSGSGARPSLARSNSSTSYLHRSRRSPSLTNKPSLPTPETTPENYSFDDQPANAAPCTCLRQSPPPVNNLTIPTGAIISPPESAQNSSDDEESEAGRRWKLENLAELQAAIRVIEQQREGSPNSLEDERKKVRSSLGLVLPNSDETPSPGIGSPPLSQEARKISHSRSNTESAVIDLNRPMVDSPERSSESDDECDIPRKKPLMLRKKSGELVRPALRATSAHRRPSSMPGTPTYSKAVHFDNNLEHVKHFLQVDRPLAVSANTSPVDNYDSDSEFPFPSSKSSWEWSIKISNFPGETSHRVQAPVRVERIQLSPDKRTLVGNVLVQNLAFHKTVVARFTLDYWKTISEVTAEYCHEVQSRRDASGALGDGRDRFAFHLRLEDHVNLENKTLFFCVRYHVNGQEFWDSNDGMNYQVSFAKEPSARSNAPRPLSTAIPHGTAPGSLSAPGGRARPVSMPSFDDFASGFEAAFPRPPMRLRTSSKDAVAAAGPDRIMPDAPGLKQKTPATQAFGTRYDFGASLSAAIQAASSTLGERSGLLSQNKNVKEEKPADLSRGKPPLQSQSYNELIDKYCFFGSAKSPSPVASSSVPAARNSPPPPPSQEGSKSPSPRTSPILDQKTTPATTPPAPPSPPSVGVRASRSPSPANRSLGSRAASPMAFGYPYHQPAMSMAGFDGCTPTAIKG